MVGGRLNDQDGAPPAVIIQLPATADDAFAVLPQDLRIAVGACAVQQMRHGLNLVARDPSPPTEIVLDRLVNASRLLIRVMRIRGSIRNDLARFTGTHPAPSHLSVN
jgi:hypothetical protein